MVKIFQTLAVAAATVFGTACADGSVTEVGRGFPESCMHAQVDLATTAEVTHRNSGDSLLLVRTQIP